MRLKALLALVAALAAFVVTACNSGSGSKRDRQKTIRPSNWTGPSRSDRAAAMT